MNSDPCCERDLSHFTCHGADRLECMINRALMCNEIAGISMGIYACGSNAFELNMGQKNANGDPVTSDTVFQAGGVAMPFLAAWLARKITLDQPNPLLQKNFPQGFNTRISSFGDIRQAGPYSGFESFDIGNGMSHELVLGPMDPELLPHNHDLFLPHPYDTSVYEPFEETNPVVRPPWQYLRTSQVEVLNYVLSHEAAENIADTLGVNLTADLISFLITELGLTPTDGTYGKAAFEALPDIAEPLIREDGDWKHKYVYNGDPQISTLGLSINLIGLLKLTELYANKGILNDETIIDCSVLEQTLRQRTAMVINPFPGQWDSAIGWKHIVTDDCRNRVVVMMTYLITGGRALIVFWPEKSMGIGILCNNLNPYPEAIAAYIVNYFSSFDVGSATDAFNRALRETEQYMKQKYPVNALVQRPICREINIIDTYYISNIGWMHFFLDGDSLKAEFNSHGTVYGPALVTSLGNNSYYYKFTDLSGIPTLVSMVFSYDGQFQPNMMNAYLYGGNVRFHKIRADDLSCLSYDPAGW